MRRRRPVGRALTAEELVSADAQIRARVRVMDSSPEVRRYAQHQELKALGYDALCRRPSPLLAATRQAVGLSVGPPEPRPEDIPCLTCPRPRSDAHSTRPRQAREGRANRQADHRALHLRGTRRRSVPTRTSTLRRTQRRDRAPDTRRRRRRIPRPRHPAGRRSVREGTDPHPGQHASPYRFCQTGCVRVWGSVSAKRGCADAR